MGRYDDISGEELEARLRKLARLIRAMDKDGTLLQRTGSLLRLLGELRQMLFAWEVRSTRHLLPDEDDDVPGAGAADDADSPQVEESRRIVDEARERERELQDELRDRLFPGNGEEAD